VPGFSPRSLAVKGLFIVALPLAFEIAFALSIIVMDRAARVENEARRRTTEISGSAYHLLSLLVDAETATRGYIIARQPQFTEPYDKAVRLVPIEVSRLRTLTPELQPEVNDLATRAGELLKFQGAQQHNVATGAHDQAAEVIASGAGKQMMDAFRQAMDHFLVRRETLEQSRAEAHEVARRRLRTVIFSGLAVNVLVAVGMAMFFTRNITRRLAVLVDNTLRVERHEPMLARVGGGDEIAQLDGRFHEMVGALEQGRRELQAANAEMESFTYSVSHDLRAPLRAVSGYARMVEEDFAERLDDEGRRYLATIRGEARRMGRLIDDLLAFSRLGRNTLQLAPVDVETLVGDIVTSLDSAADPRVRIAVDAPPPALADRDMLRQALVNLIANAIKFSSRGDETHIEVGGSRGGAHNVYWVRDHGVGFDMRFADKLFGVFQRLHAADEFEGTGVGLAIVHRVISKHGGRVWAESEEGRGACFYFTLRPALENG
jgi:signal transduction histidine kinase